MGSSSDVTYEVSEEEEEEEAQSCLSAEGRLAL
jgi:hypothetical protein